MLKEINCTCDVVVRTGKIFSVVTLLFPRDFMNKRLFFKTEQQQQTTIISKEKKVTYRAKLSSSACPRCSPWVINLQIIQKYQVHFSFYVFLPSTKYLSVLTVFYTPDSSPSQIILLSSFVPHWFSTSLFLQH
jgi:hypothetical protein